MQICINITSKEIYDINSIWGYVTPSSSYTEWSPLMHFNRNISAVTFAKYICTDVKQKSGTEIVMCFRYCQLTVFR